MKNELCKVTVSKCHCGCCGTLGYEVHHPNFPEFGVSGTSARQAAERLVLRLETSLDVVSPADRVPVEDAIEDLRLFLDTREAARPARTA